VLLVSDHGAQPLCGGIAVNEWLVQQGYLVLREYPSLPTPPQKLAIDWPRTRVWSEGGYYARVFLNVRGREPQGAIEPEEYEAWRDRLVREMQGLRGPAGEELGTRVYRPQELFRECRGVPPDLICYWGNLRYRSVGSVGARAIHVAENDTGPDEANHDWDGIFISREPLVNGPGLMAPCAADRASRPLYGGRLGLRLLDIGPSILAAAGLPVPHDAAGQACLRW
jgi:predicted AlkP superfamily phosphohydrolase/phosphomutase